MRVVFMGTPDFARTELSLPDTGKVTVYPEYETPSNSFVVVSVNVLFFSSRTPLVRLIKVDLSAASAIVVSL